MEGYHTFSDSLSLIVYYKNLWLLIDLSDDDEYYNVLYYVKPNNDIREGKIKSGELIGSGAVNNSFPNLDNYVIYN